MIWGFLQFFRRSLVAQIIAGVAAFGAAWAANNYVVGQRAAKEKEREIIENTKREGARRNEKVRDIRRSIERDGAWERLRQEYGVAGGGR